MPRWNKVRLDVLVLNRVIYSSMACTEYKTIVVGKMEKSAPLYTKEPASQGLSLVTPSHKRRRWPLSLLALVSDPAASRPPAEREDVHRLSVRRR